MVAENFGYDTTAGYFGDGHDMFHMAFDFEFGFFFQSYMASATGEAIARRFTRVRDSYPEGAQNALFIGSHDLARVYERVGGIESRARRGAFVQMTMPGTPFVYYGEELGLRPGTAQLVDERDHERTPMLWSAEPGWGFTSGTPWLAFGAEPETTHRAAEQGAPDSTYEFYRRLLALRRGREAFGSGSLELVETDESALLLWTRASADETYAMVLSMDEASTRVGVASAMALPAEPQLLLGDASLAAEGSGARVTVPAAGMAVFRLR
jgi:alpha-glucosidase